MRTALDFIAEVERDFSATPLFLGSNLADVNLEAVHNQHSVSLTAEQAQQLTVENLTQLLRGIIAAKREQLRVQGDLIYPMQLYCWHD